MRGFRYRLYPNKTQEAELHRLMGICCDTWNAALEQRITWWRMGTILDSRGAWDGERDKSKSQTRQLQQARKELGLRIPAQVHNHVLVRLDRAFDAFRRRRREGRPGGFPRFCPRQKWRTLVFPSYGQSHAWILRAKNGKVRLRGVGDIKVRMHRPLPENLGQATVTILPSGRWEIAITVRETAHEPLPATGKRVGINRGVRHFLAASDGTTLAGFSRDSKVARELATAQRALSRTQRGSAGRETARKHLARIHARVKAQHDQMVSEIARILTAHHDEIVIEDYDSAGMIATANKIAPKLGGRIAEQSWGLLERRLRDRCERHGRTLVVVDAAGISQTCPRCRKETPHPLAARNFACDCGYEQDRDVAAARIVLQRADDPEMVRERYDGEEVSAP